MSEATAPPSPSAPRPKTFLLKVLVVAALGVVILLVTADSFMPLVYRGHNYSSVHAIGRLRSYVTSQAVHASSDKGDPGYADDLGKLAKEGGIYPAFAAAHGPKGTPIQGYLFQELKTLGGKPIDWKKDFALSATPAPYSSENRRTFMVLTSGMIYSKDFGKSEFIESFPSDPEKAGWVVVE